MLFCRLLFFSKSTFLKNYFRILPSECQKDWIQIRHDILLGLIWVQTVCKHYQQTTLGDKELNRYILILKKSVLKLKDTR